MLISFYLISGFSILHLQTDNQLAKHCSCAARGAHDWNDRQDDDGYCQLHHNGEVYHRRFMDPDHSRLYDVQKDALKGLVKWFGDEETKNCTAVVVMPTGTGKTTVICCLPYTIGAAMKAKDISLSQINLKKPILILSPCLTINRQLKKSLSTKGDLRELHLITAKDVRIKGSMYTVYAIPSTTAVSELDDEVQEDVVFVQCSEVAPRE